MKHTLELVARFSVALVLLTLYVVVLVTAAIVDPVCARIRKFKTPKGHTFITSQGE